MPEQPQSESLHVCPCGHLVVQSPQCAGLFSVFTHSGGMPHAVLFDGQTQTLASQM